MSTLLLIETSGTYCSVSLCKQGEILFNKKSTEALQHSALLGVFVDEAISVAENKSCLPEAIAISSGPGSYTGLRIGTATAKGLCYGYGIPLIAIPTLQLMANQFIQLHSCPADALLCPMIDARRMEVYTALFDAQGKMIKSTSAEIIEEDFLAGTLAEKQVFFFGDGAKKVKQLIVHDRACFVDDVNPEAMYMLEQAEKALQEKAFEDVAYFEPFYLKNFVATSPKKKFF